MDKFGLMCAAFTHKFALQCELSSIFQEIYMAIDEIIDNNHRIKHTFVIIA